VWQLIRVQPFMKPLKTVFKIIIAFLFFAAVGYTFNSNTGFEFFEFLGEQNITLAQGVTFQKPNNWALHKHEGKFGGYELTTRLPRAVDRVGLYSVKMSELDPHLTYGEWDGKLIGAALLKQISNVSKLNFVEEYQQVSFDSMSFNMKGWSEYKLKRNNSIWVFYYTTHNEEVVVINFTHTAKEKADLNIREIIEHFNFQGT
jgi:hypothetical protein